MTIKEYGAVIEQSKKTILNSLKEPNLTDDDVADWLQYFKHTLANYTGMEKIAGVFDRAESIVRNSIWIPVMERLPESGIDVLTVDRYGEYEINHIIGREDGEWYWGSVIAWMPLPESYKEKSND